MEARLEIGSEWVTSAVIWEKSIPDSRTLGAQGSELGSVLKGCQGSQCAWAEWVKMRVGDLW